MQTVLANESGAEEKEWDAGGRRTRRAGNGRASGQLLGGEHFAGGRAAGRARWAGAARGPRAIWAARIFAVHTFFCPRSDEKLNFSARAAGNIVSLAACASP